ncbi:hypothetical protein EV122DRAFT_272529 [Schizophyllum commune]
MAGRRLAVLIPPFVVLMAAHANLAPAATLWSSASSSSSLPRPRLARSRLALGSRLALAHARLWSVLLPVSSKVLCCVLVL